MNAGWQAVLDGAVLTALPHQVSALAKRAAYQALRIVPGTRDFRRDLRDSAWLSEADAVIVSFPKSGRTYLRAMLARLYQRQFGVDERDLLDFDKLRHSPPSVPRLLFTHAGDAMRRPEDVQMDIHMELSAYRDRKVVMLVRHPGDVVVSRHHHLKHRSTTRARRRLAEQPLEQFVWT
ncbi:MAG TPA: sulfotransferase domain-containing protein, partial [Sphingomicrobium sp.]|nr:sulfotransferase domain-containing protein [Sphingomicrobium sp.]